MSVDEMSGEPVSSVEVPQQELPSSIRSLGPMAWVREPLDDAGGGRRQVIAPPAAATIGTPAHGAKAALRAELATPNTVFMRGDNPELPRMPKRPTLADFFRLRFDEASRSHMLQSATQQPATATWTPATESAPPESAIGVHVAKALA
jgi:hypothetical protein